MAKGDADRTVVPAFIGSSLLGLGAYSSHKLNQLGNSLGISGKLELNPEAVRAIEDYALLRPSAVNPENFAVQYAMTANRAGNSQLFINDPRKVWEWEINSPEVRRGAKKIQSGMVSRLERTRDILRGILPNANSIPLAGDLNSKLDSAISFLKGNKSFSPLDEYGQALVRDTGGKAKAESLLAHTPEMAQSQLSSYIRLLSEIAPSMGNPRALADATTEAILHYKNPTFAEHIGKSYSSPSEYLTKIWHKGRKDIPSNLYDKYINSFAEAVSKAKTSGELTEEVLKQLVPSVKPVGRSNAGAFVVELKNALGLPVKWKFSPDKTSIIRNGEQMLSPGIRTLQDAVDKSLGHSGLQLLNARAAVGYGNTGIRYGSMFDKFNLFQRLRGRGLRYGLAAGALGLGTLGVSNIVHNIKRRNSTSSKVKKLLGIS